MDALGSSKTAKTTVVIEAKSVGACCAVVSRQRDGREGRVAQEQVGAGRWREGGAGQAEEAGPAVYSWAVAGDPLSSQLSGSRSLGQSRVTLALAATIRRNPAVSQWLSVRWISFGKILRLKINFVSREELESSLRQKLSPAVLRYVFAEISPDTRVMLEFGLSCCSL